MSPRHHPLHDDLDRLLAPGHPRGGPPLARPIHGHPFGGGRGRARRGDVRAALLLLLAEEPRNGYQLMQEIEARSGGRWRPSPGSVYPALAQLEDQGYVRARERDGTRQFEITDDGREHAGLHAGETPPWETDREPDAGRFAAIRALVAQTVQAAWQVAQVGSEAQLEQASELLAQTRRSLYRILAEEPDAGAGEPREEHEPRQEGPEA